MQAHTGDNSEPSESCTGDGQQHGNAGVSGEAAGGGELDSAFERLMRLVLRDFVEARPEPPRLRPGAPHANRRGPCAQRWFSSMISDDGEFASHVASLLPHVKAALLPRLRAISPERLARSLAAVVALAQEHLRCLELAHLHVRLTTQPAADERAAAEPRVAGSAGPDGTICAAYVRAVRHPVARSLHPGASSAAAQAAFWRALLRPVLGILFAPPAVGPGATPPHAPHAPPPRLLPAVHAGALSLLRELLACRALPS